MANELNLADLLEKNHASLANILANQHHAEAHSLASHSTKAHSELTNVLTSQHHVKTVASELNLADLLEKNHANLTNVLTSQHHVKTVKYLDSEAVSAMGVKGDSNPLHHDRPEGGGGEVRSLGTLYYGLWQSFAFDNNGDVPNGWTDISGAGCSATIIHSLGGHLKVLQLHDGSGTTKAEIYHDFTARAAGMIELWVRTTDKNQTLQLKIMSGAGEGILLAIRLDDWDYYLTGTGWTHLTDYDANNTWYRIGIDWDCATDTFDFYINGALIDSGLGFRTARATLSRLWLATANAETGYYVYIDAIGFRTEPNYTTGDNDKEVKWVVE